MDRAQRELMRGYLAKARDKARVARDLFAKGDWEDAVSRAYYAAYHAAQAALLTEGQRGETHRGVVLLFGLLLVKTGKLDRRWGKLLANLKDDREASDYDALSFVDEATARRALEEAEAFVAHVGSYVGALMGEQPAN
ncbi:MAG: HEPN domain-containing protein [Candidatus Rokubacteria bacterium]|nr:HEPN domain-containing protein [Candidatus Rokubacteria bacterium]